MDEEPIIYVEGLTKRYGDLLAVDSVSFSVFKGEIFGILGPNGAGKTTTVEILEGMRQPGSGTALVAGIDVTKDPSRVKAVIGVQLQSSSFFDGLSLSEILIVFNSLYKGCSSPEVLLESVQLADKARSRYKDLSGGQRQRFSIAVALCNNPIVLFLDEPTTGLDPQARRHMWLEIQNLQELGKTIVLTTHYMEEAEELCDRVAVMDGGRVIAIGTPGTLIEELLGRGFDKPPSTKMANLEDVFLDLTGKQLREK